MWWVIVGWTVTPVGDPNGPQLIEETFDNEPDSIARWEHLFYVEHLQVWRYSIVG